MMYTLLIDGHNFLFRTMYVFPAKKGVRMLSTEESQKLFVSKLEQNLNAVLRDLENIVDRCIFIMDSASWRKQIESDVDYKGTRHQDDTIDFDGFEKCLNQFAEILKTYNVTVSKTKRAEADDLIFYWSNILTSKGIPVIMYTSDKDMLQLVRSVNGVPTILYSDVTKKVYTPKAFLESEDVSETIYEAFSKKHKIDVFDVKSQFGYLAKKRSLEMIEVDADECLFTKVIVGDKSDNISSVYSYTKNGRTFNVTEKKAEKILEIFKDKVCQLNPEYLYLDDTIGALADSCCEALGVECRNEIISNIKRNTQYIALNTNVIPDDVVKGMYDDVKVLAKNMKRVRYNALKAQDSVVKKTEKLFKGVDDSDMSFIKENKSLF